MATRHSTREVKIFGLYNDDVNGRHFTIIRSGTWSEVVKYLNFVAKYYTVPLFIEGVDGKLRPLMA